MSADSHDGTLTAVSRERQWWLRALAVFVEPKPVFVALREDAKEDEEARTEPLLLIVLLAGIAGVLATPRFGALFDIATQVPHAAVRVHVMGKRGVDREPATPAEARAMAVIAAEGIKALVSAAS